MPGICAEQPCSCVQGIGWLGLDPTSPARPHLGAIMEAADVENVYWAGDKDMRRAEAWLAALSPDQLELLDAEQQDSLADMRDPPGPADCHNLGRVTAWAQSAAKMKLLAQTGLQLQLPTAAEPGNGSGSAAGKSCKREHPVSQPSSKAPSPSDKQAQKAQQTELGGPGLAVWHGARAGGTSAAASGSAASGAAASGPAAALNLAAVTGITVPPPETQLLLQLLMHRLPLEAPPSSFAMFLEAARLWCEGFGINWPSAPGALTAVEAAAYLLWRLLLQLEPDGYLLVVEVGEEESADGVYAHIIRGIIFPDGNAAAAVAAVQQQHQIDAREAKARLLQKEHFCDVVDTSRAHEGLFEAGFGHQL